MLLCVFQPGCVHVNVSLFVSFCVFCVQMSVPCQPLSSRGCASNPDELAVVFGKGQAGYKQIPLFLFLELELFRRLGDYTNMLTG